MNTSNPYDGTTRGARWAPRLAGCQLKFAIPKPRDPAPKGDIGVVKRGPNSVSGAIGKLPEKNRRRTARRRFHHRRFGADRHHAMCKIVDAAKEA